jgi:hypothetical protein
MNTKAKSTMASYFGLEVKVIIRMEGWSLILYRGRKSVVKTADLHSSELSAWDTWGAPSQSSLRALAHAS